MAQNIKHLSHPFHERFLKVMQTIHFLDSRPTSAHLYIILFIIESQVKNSFIFYSEIYYYYKQLY